jgi:glucuronate isomerase
MKPQRALTAPLIHADRLFPTDITTRTIARRLYAEVQNLPIISPHGHTDPRWYAENAAFPDPARLFVTPDHYIFRMLYSQGVTLEEMGIPRRDGGAAETAVQTAVETDPRKIWRKFAEHYYLFRGTPTRLWLDQAFAELFGMTVRLTAQTADDYFDRISECLARPEFRPRALFEQFRIEVIATTESPLDPLASHKAIAASGWKKRVVTAYRPDPVVDPEFDGFGANLDKFGELTRCDTRSWHGYLEAHRLRRAYFKEHGATSTDHGHLTAQTIDLPQADAERLFGKIVANNFTEGDAELFRAQMLTEMARMSLDDGLVMQIHPGSMRNHNPALYARFGRDMGADIPTRTDYVHALKPLLDRFGNERDLTIILFTLDETAYSRELAPLAGHYPVLRLGPPWWFYDSPEGMRRFRQLATETTGFYNTVGFNDDTRAFCSIPARHDVARRVDCGYLAELVMSHLLDEDEAREVAHALAYGLAKKAYKL